MSLNKLESLIDDAENKMKENSRNKYGSSNNKWSDRHGSKSLEFQRPREKRSPCKSPEKSYEFQKPRHSSSKDKRLGQFSSSDQKRHRKYDEDFQYDSDDDKKNYADEGDRRRHSKEDGRKRPNDYDRERDIDEKDKKKHIKEENQNIFVWDRISCSPGNTDQQKESKSYDKLSNFSVQSYKSNDSGKETPAWKKIKLNDERQSSKKQNDKHVLMWRKEHQKEMAAFEKCCYCLNQPNMKRHLIIKKFEKVYLSIGDFKSLVEGHCLIVPKRHVQSFLALDEEEWREVEELKAELREFFLLQNKKLLIFETSLNFKNFPHAYLEVIPVVEDISDSAPMSFKIEILECESEWANNVKLIDLNKKNLRHSVPKNLPYFWVEFDPQVHSGFAHVIEDERNFEKNFGKGVIGGMLKIDNNHLLKNMKEDPLKKLKETMNFIKKWENFCEKYS